jgi:hypothetical protein
LSITRCPKVCEKIHNAEIENADHSSRRGISPPAAVGIGVGSFVAGLVLAFLATYLLAHSLTQRTMRNAHGKEPAQAQGASNSQGDDSEYRLLASRTHRSNGSSVDVSRPGTGSSNRRFPNLRLGGNSQYQLDPYVISAEPPALPSQAMRRSPSSNFQTSSESGQYPPPEAAHPTQVYVVHHDAGRPPVTVYTAQGAQVLELPPRYMDSGRGQSGSLSPPSKQSE